MDGQHLCRWRIDEENIWVDGELMKENRYVHGELMKRNEKRQRKKKFRQS